MTWLAETAMLAHGWRRFLMLLAAGALAGLSVPPLFILPALFAAMPIWIWALDGAETKRGIVGRIFGPAFVIGFAFGLGYFCVAFHWIGAALLTQGGIFVVLMPIAVVALAALIALFWGLGSSAAHAMWSDGAMRLFPFTGCLAAAEWARGTFFSGFPFDLLGYAMTANDVMAQSASLIGVYGLTVVVILISSTPALIWPADGRTLRVRLAPFFASIAVIAANLGFGIIRLNATPVEERPDMRIRIIQPMVLEHTDWQLADPIAVLDRLLMLSDQKVGDSPGLIAATHLIWPESVFPFWLSDYPEAFARIARLLPEDTTLLTGAPRENWGVEDEEPSGPGYNSITAIDTDGEIAGSYDKAHLVPFGEYLPFPQFFALFGIRQFVPGTEGWAAGDIRRRLMNVPGTPPFVALICYEAVFPGDLGADLDKAEFILNVTNDAWFDGSIGPAQHAHHARLRAVETGLPMIRAANSGVTMVTDGLGRVTDRLPAGVISILDATLTEKLPGSLFNRVGHWPFWLAILGFIAAGILARRRSRKAGA